MKTTQTQIIKETTVVNNQVLKEPILVSILLFIILLIPLAPSLYADHCTGDFNFISPNANQHFEIGSSVYVEVSADRPDIDHMDLSINGQPIRREQTAPYEWGRPNGEGDSQLRNLQPGSYDLVVSVRDECSNDSQKTITFHVDGNDDGNNNENNDINITPFKISVKTDNPGVSNNNQFMVPMVSANNINDRYNIDCDSDGQLEARGVRGNHTCTYTDPGEYTISIYAEEPQIAFNDVGDKEKVRFIEQWGDGRWRSMANAFRGCRNLDSRATDTPILRDVTNMSHMFRQTRFNNPRIADWDMRNVTRMSGMFKAATVFNQDIGNWNVSSVRYMDSMFTVPLFLIRTLEDG